MDLNSISSDQYRAEIIELRNTNMDMNIWMKTELDGTNILIVEKWELLIVIAIVEGWCLLTDVNVMKADQEDDVLLDNVARMIRGGCLPLRLVSRGKTQYRVWLGTT